MLVAKINRLTIVWFKARSPFVHNHTTSLINRSSNVTPYPSPATLEATLKVHTECITTVPAKYSEIGYAISGAENENK